MSLEDSILTRPIRLRGVLLLAAVAFLAGFVGAGMVAWRHTRNLVLAHELEITGLCAGGLRLSSEGHTERLATVLEGRMESAIRESSRLVGEAARLRGPSPNLIESARRAAAHYEAAGNREMREAADGIVAAVTSARN